jgi:hypothetical protein
VKCVRAPGGCFREDEIGPPGLADPLAPRGGVLQIRLLLPHRIHREGEPLFASGAHYESNILYVREDEQGVKFVAHNYAHNPVESRPVPRRPGGYEVELILPACRAESFGDRGKGEIIVRVDGEVVLQVVDVWHGFHPGEEQYGRNCFGTNCAAEFRGWMLDARWVREWADGGKREIWNRESKIWDFNPFSPVGTTTHARSQSGSNRFDFRDRASAGLLFVFADPVQQSLFFVRRVGSSTLFQRGPGE